MALHLIYRYVPGALPAPEPIRLMFVDDAADARLLVSALLEDEEDIAVVAQAASAEEALDRLEPVGPAVVVVDVRLPEMGGFELCEEVRRRRPEAAVVMLSAHLDPEARRRARAAGAAAAMDKAEISRVAEVVRRVARR